MDAQLQEWLTLAVVALVVGAYVLYRRRRRAAGSCGDCASAGPPPKETVVRFYRRDPSGDGTRPQGKTPP